MADEDDGFALLADDHLGRGDIALVRHVGFLDDSDAVVVLLEVVNALPAGAVRESAVH